MTCAICEHYSECEMAKLRFQFCSPLLEFLGKRNEKYNRRAN